MEVPASDVEVVDAELVVDDGQFPLIVDALIIGS